MLLSVTHLNLCVVYAEVEAARGGGVARRVPAGAAGPGAAAAAAARQARSPGR
jgi:hypothetical protein